MLRLIGTLFKLAVFLMILLGIAAAAIVFFINPNNFKAEANELLQDYTGHAFEISGPITYSVWPKLVLSFQDINLKSPLIEVKQANIYIDPYSLMGNALSIENLELSEVTATVDNLAIAPASIIKSQANIKLVSVEKSTLILKNEQTKQNWELRNLSFATKNIVLGADAALEPINFSGTLINVNNSASFIIDAVLTADFDKKSMSLNPINVLWNDTKAHGDAVVSQYTNNVSVAGNITVDQTNITELLKKLDPYFAKNDTATTNMLQAQIAYSYTMQDEILDLSKISLKLDDGSIDGSLKLKFSNPYRAEFNLTTDKLNFEPMMMLSKAIFPAVSSNDLFPVELLKTTTIIGKLAATNLKLTPDFLVDNLSAEIMAQDGLLQINPATVAAYNSTHALNISLDVNSALPTIKLTEQTDSFPLDQWLKLLNAPNIISGNAKLKLTIDSTGNSIEALKQALNGGINLNVSDGSVYGFDIAKLMGYVTTTIDSTFEAMPSNKNISLHDMLLPKISKWLETQKGAPESAFDTLEFKADIKQGVSQTSSFDLNNAAFELKGTGSFDIVKNQINYAGVLSNKSDISSNLKEIASVIKSTPLNVPISGSFTQPILAPNIEEYTTDILKQTQDALIKKAASSMVAAAPANNQTSKAAEEIFVDSLKGLAK